MQELSELIDELLPGVTLSSFDRMGVIPLLVEKTHTAAKKQHRSGCREAGHTDYRGWANGSTQDTAHQLVEHYLRIAALAALHSGPDTRLFDLGCGVAIPALGYTLLTGNSSYAVDQREVEVEDARTLVQKLASNIEVACDTVEHFMADKVATPQPQDILLLSQPGRLDRYMANIARLYTATFIRSGVLLEYGQPASEKGAIEYATEIFPPERYRTTLSVGRDPFRQLVILAIPLSETHF